MEPAQVAPTVPNAVATPPTTADTPLPFADRMVVIAFLIGVSLFGLISVIDLIANLFR